jgi:hypothetical protein
MMKTLEHMAWEILKKNMSYLNGFPGNRSRNEPFWKMMLAAEKEALSMINERGDLKNKPSLAPTIGDILGDYLEKNGYSGFYTDECGCRIGDLMPCIAAYGHCRPGYCVTAKEAEELGYDADGAAWMIIPDRSRSIKKG